MKFSEETISIIANLINERKGVGYFWHLRLNVGHLVNELDVSESTIVRWLEKMEERGIVQIKKQSRGWYQWKIVRLVYDNEGDEMKKWDIALLPKKERKK